MALPTHTPGRWEWTSFDGGKTVHLATPDRGRLIVMDFVRSGSRGGAPRFTHRNTGDIGGILHTASHANILDFPDARLIAAAPDHALVGRLLAAGTLRWDSWGTDGRGELCFAGIRHATRVDEFGVPKIPTNLLRKLLAAGGAA